MRLMQEAADRMLDVSRPPGQQSAMHRDTIAEGALRELSGRLRLPLVKLKMSPRTPCGSRVVAIQEPEKGSCASLTDLFRIGSWRGNSPNKAAKSFLAFLRSHFGFERLCKRIWPPAAICPRRGCLLSSPGRYFYRTWIREMDVAECMASGRARHAVRTRFQVARSPGLCFNSAI